MKNNKNIEKSIKEVNHPADFLNREGFLELLDKTVESAIRKDKSKADYGAIGIDGEWGCGKSWILQEFSKRHEDEYLIFHYNAWSNDYYDEPIVGILSSMISDINSSNNFELLVKRYGSQIINKFSKDLKSVALNIISNTEIKGIKLSKVINLVKNLKENCELKFSDEYKYIGDTIDEISIILKSIKDIPIILVVDELDRCLPEYAIKVLERLHHLDMESNMIQIVALNRTNMAYGIAKTYGRYDLLNESSGNKTNIFKFSDEYFKKLFNIFLPLSNGLNNKAGILLLFDNDYLNKFKDYITSNLISRISLNISKDYFTNFYSRLFLNINIRDQKRIINLVQACHNITIEDSIQKGIYLPDFQYQHLIWEFLVCINIIISTKSNLIKWFMNVDNFEMNEKSNIFSIGYNKILHSDAFSTIVSSNFVNIFSKYKSNNTDNNILDVGIKNNSIQFSDNDSFVLAYYCIYWPLNIIMDSTGINYKTIAEKVISEQPFLRLFQENMRLLIGK